MKRVIVGILRSEISQEVESKIEGADSRNGRTQRKPHSFSSQKINFTSPPRKQNTTLSTSHTNTLKTKIMSNFQRKTLLPRALKTEPKKKKRGTSPQVLFSTDAYHGQRKFLQDLSTRQLLMGENTLQAAVIAQKTTKTREMPEKIHRLIFRYRSYMYICI